ncbi:type III secretion system export apparatus subunit SctR [Pokkaliibacter sp. CJK22405]|uniref:type III secretion system export apparatus subunit SctR n=1 Tax=Pokkaliibacter sp. CJK22405 TaxID=3384615 RepID=UPI003984FADD
MNLGEVDPLIFAVFLGGLSLLPIMLIVCSAFLKISMVLMITRNAMGVQQVPPNMAIYGIALAATLFVMAPVFKQVSEQVKETPPDFSTLDAMQESVNQIVGPLQKFMSRNSDPDVVTHLMGNTAMLWPKDMAKEVHKDDLLITIPAFMLSELQAGLKIGFLIYIPFIVIDLIVSNVLLALGMQMVSPMTISLPLKILLFVLVDGWGRLLDGLFYTYVQTGGL